MKKPTVLVDLSKLKNPYCGLGQVAVNFGYALSKMEHSTISPVFLLPKGSEKIFNNNIQFEYLSLKRRYLQGFCRKYDIWHATHQDSPYFPSDKTTPYILTIHDLNFLEEKKTAKAKKRLYRLQKKVNRASAITVVSEFTKSIVSQHLEIPGIPVQVIYNGVKISEQTSSRKPSFVPDGDFLFTIGVIKEKKNFHVLVDFMETLPQYNLIIAGDKSDKYAGYIQKLITEKNLDGRIIIPGKISGEDKNWLYKNCSAFVFPSLLEGFGLPVIEAMSFGKPVFVSKHSSLPEIAGKEVYYFTDFDKENMKNIFLIKMQEYNNDAGKDVKIKEYAGKFTWELAARQYVDLYTKFIIH